MPLTTLPAPPTHSTYTTLNEHQSQTPQTFFGARPVLHAHCGGCHTLTRPINLEHSGEDDDFARWWKSIPRTEAVNGHESDAGRQVHDADGAEEFDVKRGIDVWVGDDALILSQPFPPGTSNDTPPSALKIPYQALSLHATQRVFSSLSDPASSTARPHYNTRSLQTTSPPDQATLHPISALYLQLDPSHHLRDQANPDDEDESTTLDLFIIPAQTSSPQDNNTNGTSTALDSTPPTAPAVTELFAALTRCADLNPDPVSQDADTDGDVEAHGPALGGFPGEGGWITAENAGEFDGHSGVEIELGDGGAILGPGAGLRRGRDGEGVDGEAGEEAKWRRMG